jgi:hypothetical protein
MNNWISYLLADIADAHCKDVPSDIKHSQSIEDHLREVEAFIYGPDPQFTLSDYCGLQSVNFPPAGQLTENDLTIICDAFRKMLFSWNLDIDLPENFPGVRAYQFMVNTLDEKIAIDHSGITTFDYCSGYAPGCAFKEYCPCLKYWNSADEDM